MRFIWNLLAIFGLAAIVGVGFLAFTYKDLDPGAAKTYFNMAKKLAERR